MSATISISPAQFARWSHQARRDFLLQAVAEWQALFEACHGRPTRTGFDQAWRVADHLLDRVDELPQPPEPASVYTLVHTVLTAAEKGAQPEPLRRGVEAYCQALPAEEAGLILLETICDAPSPPEPN